MAVIKLSLFSVVKLLCFYKLCIYNGNAIGQSLIILNLGPVFEEWPVGAGEPDHLVVQSAHTLCSEAASCGEASLHSMGECFQKHRRLWFNVLSWHIQWTHGLLTHSLRSQAPNNPGPLKEKEKGWVQDVWSIQKAPSSYCWSTSFALHLSEVSCSSLTVEPSEELLKFLVPRLPSIQLNQILGEGSMPAISKGS